jgi:hypothetical protein
MVSVHLQIYLLSLKHPTIVSPASSTFNAMAQKTLREFLAPSADNVHVGLAVNIGGENFMIKTGLITMVQASPFLASPMRALAHISNNFSNSTTLRYQGSHAGCDPTPTVLVLSSWDSETMVLCQRSVVDTYPNFFKAFLTKFFSMDKTNALQRILSFQQASRVHPGQLAHSPELQQWVDANSS